MMKPNTINLELNDYFNSISKDYKVNEYASLYTTKLMRKLAINCIKDFKNKLVLDLMSGTGENISLLNNTYELKQLTALDYSAQMNLMASKKLKHINFNLIEGDFFETKQLNTYDIILCSFGVKTFSDKSIKEFCCKTKSLLNPNGELVILELVKPKSKLITLFLKFYLNTVISSVFGEKFKLLFPFIEANKNLNKIKTHLTANNLTVLKHKRHFFMYEVIHAKNPSTL